MVSICLAYSPQTRSVDLQRPALTTNSVSSPEPPKNKAKAQTPIFDEDKYNLLTENFELGFDDDLEAIFAIGFVGVVSILPAEYGEV